MKEIQITILKKEITYGYKDDPEMPSVKVKFILTINNHILTCTRRMKYEFLTSDFQLAAEIKQLFK